MARTRAGAAQRENIRKVARRLFATQGYAATGVREIAREAGVTLGAVSYYFGGKRGLLEDLLSDYFDAVLPRAKALLESEAPPREVIRGVVAAAVEVFGAEPELLRILVSQLPLSPEEGGAIPRDRLAPMIALATQRLLPALPGGARHGITVPLLFPAAMGLVAGHFLLRPQFEALTGARFDDDFYERFPDLVVGLLFDGLEHIDPALLHLGAP